MDVNFWAVALPSAISATGAFVGVLLGLGSGKKSRDEIAAWAARSDTQSLRLKFLDMLREKDSSVANYDIELLTALLDSGNLSDEQELVITAALSSKIARKVAEYHENDTIVIVDEPEAQ